MKQKAFNIALFIFSLLGYLEWGKSSSIFLYQAEMEILSKIFTNPASIVHPFILIPLLGQVILLFTLFQKQPTKLLTFIGLFSIAMLFMFMLFIGIISKNYKITLSTIPFLVTAVLIILDYRNKNK